MKAITSLFTFLLLSLNACNLEDQETYDYFTCKVDSVTAPESVKVSEPINIELFGTVGGNGNYSFDKIEVKTKDNLTEIRVVGKFDKRGKNAVTVVIGFGEKYSIQPSKKGEFILHILQPDNSYIEKKIQIL